MAGPLALTSSISSAAPQSPEQSPLEHNCTIWRKSSQIAFNIYMRGTKFWSQSDLLDIEQQLAQSKEHEVFRLRLIDGGTLAFRNPMFGEEFPIWQPRVKFQEYWRLVQSPPDGPPDTYHCSYTVEWVNTTAMSFRGCIANASSLFEESRLVWSSSHSCKLVKSLLTQTPALRHVKKIVCFGLGDICRKPPEWLRRKSVLKGDSLDASFVRAVMVQHSIALTLAQICRDSTGKDVQLLAQDPSYAQESKDILSSKGFSIIGKFGAGGFAEVDDSTLVFSVFVEAPAKQIIADIARPPIIISTGFDTFNDSEKPWADAESPRTREMWRDYENTRFPIAPEDDELMSHMQSIFVYTKNEHFVGM